MDWVLSSRDMRATAEAVDKVRVEGVRWCKAGERKFFSVSLSSSERAAEAGC